MELAPVWRAIEIIDNARAARMFTWMGLEFFLKLLEV